MPRKAKSSTPVYEPHEAVVLSSRPVASCGSNIHTVRANNNQLYKVWNDAQCVPIGTTVLIAIRSTDGKAFFD